MSETITVRHPDGSRTYRLAPEWITRACQVRFESHASCVVDSEKPDTYKFNPENFWDGYTEVRLVSSEPQQLEFTDVYSWEDEVFSANGKTVSRGPVRRR